MFNNESCPFLKQKLALPPGAGLLPTRSHIKNWPYLQTLAIPSGTGHPNRNLWSIRNWSFHQDDSKGLAPTNASQKANCHKVDFNKHV